MKVGFFVGCNTAFNRPDLEKAFRFVMNALGVEIDDLDGQSCCPSWGTMPSVDEAGWYALGARNFIISEEKNVDMVTVCGSCYGSLSETKYNLDKRAELREKVNEMLKAIGKEYKGSTKIRLATNFFYNEIGIEKIKNALKYTLEGVTIGVQPGCHSLWPSEVYSEGEKDPFHPVMLRELCEALGASAPYYSRILDCCGMGGMRSTNVEASYKLVKTKLDSMKEEIKADLLVTGCSSCLIQFDTAQAPMRKDKKIDYEIPSIHYVQLLALCLGADPQQVVGLSTTDLSGILGKLKKIN
ncbi:CoB--CoM heterodisulfide reductase iron-sulfur subunit B family protein [Thermodesulfobium sp.]|jgi:heterodisulfide reductase subunit B|uniref:Heterodisulfide reductase n=1 Tax=Thermodesulfobium narugense TaxID=184064 RepID=A0A7C5PPX6_9BACT